jgi:enterochelin esterase family protein
VPTEPTTQSGPDVDASSLTFGLDDPDRRLRGVRLQQDARIPGDRLDFTWSDGRWRLSVDRPPVDRMEYLLELTHADGSTESVTDPENPLRAPGAFGDKSVLELPGYLPPRWLDLPAPAGNRRTVALSTRSLGEDLQATIWSPEGVDDDEPLPLLAAHDGPEYDSLAQLTTYLSAGIHEGTLPRLRAALLPPGDRDDRYSAEGAYTRALCLAVIPGLQAEVPTTVTIGMGASLGALAMLHAQRQHPQCFDALFLQSGSFFHPRHDSHERRFSQYERVVRSVATVLRSGGHPSPVPTVMTCGTIEENLANNRIMARALAAQGYDVTLREVRDAHTFTAWRDAFDPWLTGLLRVVAA